MSTEKNLPDGRINQQWLAEEIARREGKKKQVDIGQIKEQLKIILRLFANDLTEDELDGLILKHKK